MNRTEARNKLISVLRNEYDLRFLLVIDGPHKIDVHRYNEYGELTYLATIDIKEGAFANNFIIEFSPLDDFDLNLSAILCNADENNNLNFITLLY